MGQGQAFSTAMVVEHVSAPGREKAMFSGEAGLGHKQRLLSEVGVLVLRHPG